jgi:membrane protease YdiL (CAAX protease family)
MNPENLTPTQLIITSAVSLFFLTIVFGSLFVHAWVLIAWRRVMTWSGWLRDQFHDQIGLVDLLGCLVYIVLAQIAVAGIFYQESKRSIPRSPAPIDSPVTLPAPAWINAALALRQEVSQTESLQESGLESGLESELKGESVKVSSESLKESPWFMFAATLSLVLGSLASAVWTLARLKRSPRAIGISSGRLWQDILVGVTVFLWITPLVILVNVFVSQMTEIQYEHPVIDSLKGRPWAFPLLFASAAVFAPLWEEYAFRFLLVNWLDTIRWNSLDLMRIFWGGGPGPDQEAQFPAMKSVLDGQPIDTMVDETTEVVQAGYPPWWIAIASGVLFGLAHFDYGVSWVPLMVLGTVLARVYQLQRSILPCFIIHALFNSLAMAGFAMELFVKPSV